MAVEWKSGKLYRFSQLELNISEVKHDNQYKFCKRFFTMTCAFEIPTFFLIISMSRLFNRLTERNHHLSSAAS